MEVRRPQKKRVVHVSSLLPSDLPRDENFRVIVSPKKKKLPWPKKRPKAHKPKPLSMQGQGQRIKEVNKVSERYVDPEKRVARLVQIAHEHGADFLRREIATHERKIADLKAALAEVEKGESNEK